MKLHVLTAVSRPWNLPLLEQSIKAAERNAPNVSLEWHTRFDVERQHVGGQHLKNLMLDEIDDGWVCVLDDDTVMHDHFLVTIYNVATRYPTLRALVVAQKRTTGKFLRASAANAVVGKIDAGQAVLRRDLIGDSRIPETYAGDGAWLENLLRGRADVRYMSNILSLHNILTGVDVSEPPERMGA